VISHDGAQMLEATRTGPSSEAEALGLHVAEALLAQGAQDLIRAAREA
jgi:porphobilinogen deaminase